MFYISQYCMSHKINAKLPRPTCVGFNELFVLASNGVAVRRLRGTTWDLSGPTGPWAP